MRYQRPGGIFDSERIGKEIADLEAKTAVEGFWNNREEAEKVMGEIKRKKDLINPWKDLKGLLDDTVEMYDLAMSENDESFEADIAATIEKMKSEYSRLRTLALFSEETDVMLVLNLWVYVTCASITLGIKQEDFAILHPDHEVHVE